MHLTELSLCFLLIPNSKFGTFLAFYNLNNNGLYYLAIIFSQFIVSLYYPLKTLFNSRFDILYNISFWHFLSSILFLFLRQNL